MPIPDTLRAFRQSLLDATIVTLLIAALAITLSHLLRDSVTVEPLQVPNKLADRGYTPCVAAQHLIEQVRSIHDRTDTTSATTPFDGFERDWFIPDFVVPTAGLSFKTAVAYLRGLLSLDTYVISGELLYATSEPLMQSSTRVAPTQTQPQSPNLSLRLRINGAPLPSATGTDQEPRMSRLFHDGAIEVVKAIEPLALAEYHYWNGDIREIETLIDFVRATRPGTHAELRALNLRGVLLVDTDKYDDAIEQFQQAFQLNRQFGPTLANWGLALAYQGKHDESISRLRQALVHDNNLPSAYANWGFALMCKGDTPNAIAKFAKAIELDPDYAYAHQLWLMLLQNTGDTAAARDREALLRALNPSVTMDPNSLPSCKQ